MTENRQYGIRRVVALPYEEAVEKTKEALKQQGFDVLSEIDMKAKLKEKLGVDYKRYVILGACKSAPCIQGVAGRSGDRAAASLQHHRLRDRHE